MGFVKKLLLAIQGKPKSLDEKIKETAKQIKAERKISLLTVVTLLAITILAVFVLRDAKIAFGYGQITMIEHQLIACSMLLMILSFGFGFLYVEYLYKSADHLLNFQPPLQLPRY